MNILFISTVVAIGNGDNLCQVSIILFRGPQWLVGLASTPTSCYVEDLSQYDPGC